VQRLLGWSLVALIVVLDVVAIVHEPDEPQVRWADELTGEVARVNDVIALELLPAVTGPVDPGAEAQPDLVGVAAACEHLDPAADSFASVVGSERAHPAAAVELGERYVHGVRRFADDCLAVAAAGDGDALFEGDLGSQLEDLAAIAQELGEMLPSDATCPERLMDEVQTCAELAA
jgi:hypothetical protein